MKVLVSEVENEGLVALLGKRVTLYCATYIYVGTLVGVNDKCVKLDNASIVYETGPFGDKSYKVKSPFPNNVWYVTTHSIESFGLLKDE